MIARLAVSITLALCTAAGPAAAQTVDCYAASKAVGEKRWAEAERQLRRHIATDACADQRPQLTYSLAYVLEMRAGGDPDTACEAEALYGEALDGLTQAPVRDAAAQGRTRVGATCACQPPDALLGEGRWSEAVERAESRERMLACAPYAADLRAARARALEAWAGEDPAIACRAATALESMAAAPLAAPETAPRARNMRLICAGLDVEAPADSARPLILGVSAAAFAAVGTGLLVGSLPANDRRRDAERRYVQAIDQAARDAAAADFEDSDSLTSGLVIGGWAAVAVAAGLGAGLAVELLGAPASVQPALAPGAAGVVVRF